MDPYQHEHELRAHIRHLLLDYAKTHLTKDYQTFTEDAVAELLSKCLSIVPTADPNSLTLPEDPFHALSRILALPDLKPYDVDEKWPADRDAIQLLRTVFTFPGKPSTKRCWDNQNEFDYSTSIFRPMSPVLTTRSIRETPKPGSGVALRSLPKSQGDALKSLKRVDPEIIEEAARVKLEDALNLRPVIDSATYSSILALYKSVPGMFPPKTLHANSHLDEFLGRSGSPPPTLPRLEFLPMFPRTERPGGNQTFDNLKPVHPSIPKGLSDLQSMLPETNTVDDEYNDLHKQHMIVVDGWQTFAPSSPSSVGTPSLGSGTSDVDELFLMSPPGAQPALIEDLMASRIDETEIPRSRKIGGTLQKTNLIGDGQSLGSFLSPFVSNVPVVSGETSNPRIVTTPRSSPRSSIGVSMLGQPSSLLETTYPSTSKPSLKEAAQDMDLDAMVGHVYASVREDPVKLILEERLDEKGGMLMDVPIMLQPNVHPLSPLSLPTTMHAFLHSSTHSQSADSTHRFLKKVTGLKSLNMELSWRPVQFGCKIPTDEEVTRVEGSIKESEVPYFADIDDTKVAMLFRLSAVSSDLINGSIFRGWDRLESDIKPAEPAKFEAVLTREERRRLAGISGGIDQSQFNSDPALPYPLDGFDVENCTKEEEDGLWIPFGDETPNNLSRQRDAVVIDDSGISFANSVSSANRNDSEQDHRLVDEHSSPQDANKENMAPLPDHAVFQEPPATLDSREDMDERILGVRIEDAGSGTFVPLSFDSVQSRSTYGAQYLDTEHETVSAEHGGSRTFPSDVMTPETMDHDASEFTDMLPGLVADTNFAGGSLAKFLALKNISVNQNLSSMLAVPPVTEVMSEPFSIGTLSGAHAAPESIFDRSTLLLPSPWLLPGTLHRYLASMDLIQKRPIVRSLGLNECAVELVERDTLGGVDLILDPHTAVIVTSILALPSQCEALTVRLGQQSWRFARLLVVFEAFSSSLAYRSESASTRLAPNAYTPPILKAVKKLRRNLGIAEALETKNSRTSIHFAFADSVREAALFIRCFGDCAEENDTTGGTIWGSREWLDVEEQEGEQDLAGIDGMNAFAASIILCQKPLQNFLDTAAEMRVLQFGHLVGRERVILFNNVIDYRRNATMSPSQSPVQPSGDILMV